MRPNRRTTVLAIAAIATVAISGCGTNTTDKAAAAGGLTPIRVTVGQVTEPYVIPWLVAKQQGLFKQHGVDVTDIVASSGGSSTLRTLVSGGLAIGEVSMPAVVEGKAAGIPVTVVGGATRSAYGLDFYALTTNSKVNTINDAKKWAFTTPGSITEALTYLIPDAAKIDSKSIQRVAAGGSGQAVALLESGAVDVTILPPSLVAKDPSKYKLIAASAQYLPAFQQGLMTVSNSYLKDHADVVAGVLAGYQDAVGYIAKNPDEAAQIYATNIGIDKAQARTIVDGASKADNWSSGIDSVALDTATKAMQAEGFKGQVPCNLFALSRVPAGAPRDLPTKCGS